MSLFDDHIIRIGLEKRTREGPKDVGLWRYKVEGIWTPSEDDINHVASERPIPDGLAFLDHQVLARQLSDDEIRSIIYEGDITPILLKRKCLSLGRLHGKATRAAVTDIAIDDACVSSPHGILYNSDGILNYRDLNSSNGSLIEKPNARIFKKTLIQDKYITLFPENFRPLTGEVLICMGDDVSKKVRPHEPSALMAYLKNMFGYPVVNQYALKVRASPKSTIALQ